MFKQLLSLSARTLAAITLLALATVAHNATVYRTLDSDGKVVYSDKPPASGKVQKTLEITHAPASPLPDAVLRYQAELEKSAKKRLSDVAAGSPGIALLFVTQWCGYCKQAKAYLGAKGIAYQEHDIETSGGMRVYVANGGGRTGVPVLMTQNGRLTGFSPQAYDTYFSKRK